MINEYRSYAKHTRKIAAQLPLKHSITCLSIVNVKGFQSTILVENCLPTYGIGNYMQQSLTRLT